MSLEVCTNKQSMYDPKCSVESRTCTFEGLEVYSHKEQVKHKGGLFE